jgi:hypothetical protein
MAVGIVETLGDLRKRSVLAIETRISMALCLRTKVALALSTVLKIIPAENRSISSAKTDSKSLRNYFSIPGRSISSANDDQGVIRWASELDRVSSD